MTLTIQTIQCIRNTILAKYPQATIYLYGSHARGTAKAQSDIDICILMPSNMRIARFDFELNNVLTEAIGIEAHCVFCTMFNEWCELELSNYNTDTMKPTL